VKQRHKRIPSVLVTICRRPFCRALMFFTRSLLVVYKNTGGRLWNKPWGLPPLTKTQKRTRQKNNNEVQKVQHRMWELSVTVCGGCLMMGLRARHSGQGRMQTGSTVRCRR
jgi:hypothetical protein